MSKSTSFRFDADSSHDLWVATVRSLSRLLWLLLLSLLGVSAAMDASAGEIIYVRSDYSGSPYFFSTATAPEAGLYNAYYPYGQEMFDDRFANAAAPPVLSRTISSAEVSQNSPIARDNLLVDGNYIPLSFAGYYRTMPQPMLYAGSRYYDPTWYRFISVDPVEVNPEDFHTFNRYAYSRNNPIRYTDPDGEVGVGAVGVAIIGAIGVGYTMYDVSVAYGEGGFEAAAKVLARDAAVGLFTAGVGRGVIGGVRLIKDAVNVAKGVRPIKPGTANGPTAGQAFPKSVKDAAKAENPSATCVYCQMEGKGTQVDHAIPRARGGDATLPNAQLACPHCNASKGAGDFPKTPPADYVGPWPPTHW